MARIDAFLKLGSEQDCSDIHLTVGLPPLVRLDGELTALKYRELNGSETAMLLREILSDHHSQELDTRGSVDFAYASPGAGRFRINACHQMNGITAVCRVIPEQVPQLENLGLPESISRVAVVNSGLVLVTGATGTGKSTTLAGLINAINLTQSLNIVTLEDPIEFVHKDCKSMVLQREIGTHARSFGEGLRSALRQDPDVILVGEMRDRETVALAIEAAETGHLVFGTLHTRGAYQTVHRIVDVFPPELQSQIRHTLADNLKCVISQELVRVADGRGRRAVVEIMVMTPAISQLIREGKTFQIPQAIATGRRHGMQLMDQSLLSLVQSGDVDPDEAFIRATDKREFVRYVSSPDLTHLAEQAPPRSAA